MRLVHNFLLFEKFVESIYIIRNLPEIMSSDAKELQKNN